ncbi:MAG: ribonuclease HII [Patescibacteria group bacterium]|jgi:ribonuclease HII
MFYPNLRHEKKLQRQGFSAIAGLDEAGKGAWAGPIVAGAVILNPKVKIKGIKDSKLLRAPQRQELFAEITASAIAWAAGIVSDKEIDKIGITKANHLALIKALEKLNQPPDYLLIDALKINYRNLPFLAKIDGDYKITSVAAASIIAKVTRDRLMEDFDELYPQYGFKQHKGYGTSHHWQMLMEHGICEIHRTSFEPMKHFLNE